MNRNSILKDALFLPVHRCSELIIEENIQKDDFILIAYPYQPSKELDELIYFLIEENYSLIIVDNKKPFSNKLVNMVIFEDFRFLKDELIESSVKFLMDPKIINIC